MANCANEMEIDERAEIDESSSDEDSDSEDNEDDSDLDSSGEISEETKLRIKELDDIVSAAYFRSFLLCYSLCYI